MVMANMFLLAKMRQPSRILYRDLEVNTHSDFLDELLSDRNFLMESDPLEPMTQLRVQYSQGCRTLMYGRGILHQRRTLAHPRGQRTSECRTGFSSSLASTSTEGTSGATATTCTSAIWTKSKGAKEQFQQDTCWKYQSGMCKHFKCPRKHACVGCGKTDVPYDSCGCLESKIPKA